MSETNNFTEIKNESTENTENTKIVEGIKIDLLKIAFDYTKEKHNNLVTEIKEIRAVSNYILTAILAFTGFVISSDKNYISNLTQQLIIYGLLLTVLGIWLWINWIINVSVLTQI